MTKLRAAVTFETEIHIIIGLKSDRATFDAEVLKKIKKGGIARMSDETLTCDWIPYSENGKYVFDKSGNKIKGRFVVKTVHNDGRKSRKKIDRDSYRNYLEFEKKTQ